MILLAALGCNIPTPPPSAEEWPEISTTPLAEALYAGELGEETKRLGDRVRLLAWLRSMSMTQEELSTLAESSRRVHTLSRDLQSSLQALGGAEFQRLKRPYRELAISLASAKTRDSDLEAWAMRITEARATGEDPRALRAVFAQSVLEEASSLLEQLDLEKRREMANGLFLLRLEIGEGAAPASFKDLIGTPWRSEEYSTLRKSASPAGVDHLDIGGLWTLESGEVDRSEHILGDRLLVITAMALAHPDLPASCEVLLGNRDPLAFGDHPG